MITVKSTCCHLLCYGQLCVNLRMGGPLERVSLAKMEDLQARSTPTLWRIMMFPRSSSFMGIALFGRMTPERFTKPQRAKLKACEAFVARIPPDCQAPKIADVWPIENVWAIVEQRAMKKCTTSKAERRKVITKTWQKSDQDKDSCKRPVGARTREKAL